jgi:hypothetical protein
LKWKKQETAQPRAYLQNRENTNKHNDLKSCKPSTTRDFLFK